ncbi:MAG: hypothetical protein ABFC96_02605 [Thermoguttaceae bacterium]
MLGFGKWIGFGLAIPIVTLPFALVGERVLRAASVDADHLAAGRDPIRIFMISVCAHSDHWSG